MTEKIKQYAWVAQAFNILLLPMVIWYATTIGHASALAEEANKVAQESKLRLEVTCANFEAERAKVQHLWIKSQERDTALQAIGNQLSSLETHIQYIKTSLDQLSKNALTGANNGTKY